jgi:hypothetical protein
MDEQWCQYLPKKCTCNAVGLTPSLLLSTYLPEMHAALARLTKPLSRLSEIAQYQDICMAVYTRANKKVVAFFYLPCSMQRLR